MASIRLTPTPVVAAAIPTFALPFFGLSQPPGGSGCEGGEVFTPIIPLGCTWNQFVWSVNSECYGDEFIPASDRNPASSSVRVVR